jgi:hypothetical protein
MSKPRRAAVWIVRVAIGLLLFLDVFVASLFVKPYRQGGTQGVRDFISFYHLRFRPYDQPLSREELVHEAQKGYEAWGFFMGCLVLLTWAGFRVHTNLTRAAKPQPPGENPSC